MAPLLLLLLLALLASTAHAQTLTLLNLEVRNDLSDRAPGANDAKCTIAAPQLGGTGESTFFVPARSSRTVPLQASQSLSSPTFRVEVFGRGPLGMGCRACCFFFNCFGKRYTASGDFLQRVVSLVGYKIVIAGNCWSESQPKLLLEGYATSTSEGVGNVASTCVPQD